MTPLENKTASCPKGVKVGKSFRQYLAGAMRLGPTGRLAATGFCTVKALTEADTNQVKEAGYAAFGASPASKGIATAKVLEAGGRHRFRFMLHLDDYHTLRRSLSRQLAALEAVVR